MLTTAVGFQKVPICDYFPVIFEIEKEEERAPVGKDIRKSLSLYVVPPAAVLTKKIGHLRKME